MFRRFADSAVKKMITHSLQEIQEIKYACAFFYASFDKYSLKCIYIIITWLLFVNMTQLTDDKILIHSLRVEKGWSVVKNYMR